MLSIVLCDILVFITIIHSLAALLGPAVQMLVNTRQHSDMVKLKVSIRKGEK